MLLHNREITKQLLVKNGVSTFLQNNKDEKQTNNVAWNNIVENERYIFVCHRKKRKCL